MHEDEEAGQDIDSVFTKCSSCGTVLVSVPQHRCSTDTSESRPDRDERQDLAADDDRPDSTEVGIFPNNQGNRYAYHDLDEDGRPRCGSDKHTASNTLSVVTLSTAKEHGRSPCGSCRRVRKFERETPQKQ